MYEFGFGFSYFGLFGVPGRMCTALVEDLVLTSKYWNLFIFTVIVPFHHIHPNFNIFKNVYTSNIYKICTIIHNMIKCCCWKSSKQSYNSFWSPLSCIRFANFAHQKYFVATSWKYKSQEINFEKYVSKEKNRPRLK